MELALQSLSSFSFSDINRDMKKACFGMHSKSFPLIDIRSRQGEKLSTVSSALLETAASVAIAAAVVGAAATVLSRRTKGSEATQIPMKTCEDCGGSGICSECKGEGFVLKKLTEQNAEKARLTAKNAATRYTAGLPKKWSYCTKCSSARSCNTCAGQGKKCQTEITLGRDEEREAR
ncbi:hypothetical protein Ddye_025183 [Dipteronia dyeriana]|uniref:DUF7895 domain-containing protein n=1 Tax=Dipteronia dyeriana TaxID=168575 RepID=A0AAD9TX91_9ROSI|nr:hypothetical protein Ddye_025183 [Dipteronia dyeriana]